MVIVLNYWVCCYGWFVVVSRREKGTLILKKDTSVYEKGTPVLEKGTLVYVVYTSA